MNVQVRSALLRQYPNGNVVLDASRDITMIAICQRQPATPDWDWWLQHSAMASTVAHDSHNLMVAGMDDNSMMTALRAVVEMRGGMAAADKDRVLARLPLPIAGLMSDQPIETVCSRMEELLRASSALGSRLHDPFMAMSFLDLPVIPSLKIIYKGLGDVDKFQIVPLFTEKAHNLMVLFDFLPAV